MRHRPSAPGARVAGTARERPAGVAAARGHTGPAIPTSVEHSLECNEEETECRIHRTDDGGGEAAGWPVTVDGPCFDVRTGPDGLAYVGCSPAVGRDDPRPRSSRGVPSTGGPCRSPAPSPASAGTTSRSAAAPVDPRSSWARTAPSTRPSPPPPRPACTCSTRMADRATGGRRRSRATRLGRTAGAVTAAAASRCWTMTGSWPGATTASKRRSSSGPAEPSSRHGRSTVSSGPAGRKDRRAQRRDRVLDSDGGITYVSDSGKVWSHDDAGEIRPGWPYVLDQPAPPVAARDGRVAIVQEVERGTGHADHARPGRPARQWRAARAARRHRDRLHLRGYAVRRHRAPGVRRRRDAVRVTCRAGHRAGDRGHDDHGRLAHRVQLTPATGR